MAIVEHRVKPERAKVNRQVRRERWWQFGDRQPALYSTVAGLKRVLVISRIGNAFAFTFLPNEMIFNEKAVIFPFANAAPFAVLQSRVHEVWARFFSSTLKDRLTVHTLELLRNLSVPGKLGDPPHPRNRRTEVL